MVDRSSTSRTLAILAAFLGPLALIGVFVYGLNEFRDSETRTADENAGLVFNGRVNDHGAVAAMDAAMEFLDPQVVLVGPSYANTDVRREIIARHLKIPVDDVAMLSVPNSVGAHWYAVLKYRVFEAGYRPKLILVISGMQSMLLNTPLSESSWTNLEAQLDDPEDPVVQRRLAVPSHVGVRHLREQRAKVRSRWFDFLRNVGPWTLLNSGNNPSARMRKEEVRTRLDRVFHASKVDMSLYSGAGSPVVTGAVDEERDLAMLSDPSASFMPAITTLAAENGARVVWVRPPMSPDVSEAMSDIVREGMQAAAVDVITPLGGHLLDMRRVPMNVEMFANEDHMNTEGSRRFSEALGLALARMDAMYPPAVSGTPPLRSSPPDGGFDGDLPEAEAAVDQNDLWVAPGTAVTVQFPAWSPERGVFSAAIAVEHLSGDSLGQPVWTVNGIRGPLRSIEPGNGWKIWRGEGVLPVPDGPFDVVIRNPKDGPFIRLTGLGLGRRAGRNIVVGDVEKLEGSRVRLLSRFEREGDALVDRSVAPIYTSAPGRVPSARRPVVDIRSSRVARFDTQVWGFLSDEFLMGESAFGSRCSPLRITEDGVRLPLPNEPCVDVQRLGKGRTCHTPEALFFTAADGTDPAGNGRVYELELDEGRRCDGAAWLYPDDDLNLTFPPNELAVLARGATHLTLGARYLMKRKTQVRVVLKVDGEVRLDRTVEGQSFWQDDQVWALKPPIAPGTKDVTLQITNLDRTFYLIEEVALSEGRFNRPSRYAQ
ncbi:MAG: hypothetical protein GWP91_09135 [Rhodobacterales bacterium]|nr:hypothetical protein [Rhodobacterales bacterium]